MYQISNLGTIVKTHDYHVMRSTLCSGCVQYEFNSLA